MATVTRFTRSQRMSLRLASPEKRLIWAGAREEGLSVTAFVVSSARLRAEEILESKQEFRLPPPRWKAFLEALDRPARLKARLRRLLIEPSRLEKR